MAHPSRCLRPEDYTVGWISALPVELAAATKMLDELHISLPHNPDDVLYTFGKIGIHHVVMACLPAGRYGTNPAAHVAASMRSRFPFIQFCLLVGIGGGVPSVRHDVRLGDVVVSQPNESSSGVVQYDLGRNTPQGFQRTGALDPPPDSLLRLLSLYQANNIDLRKPSKLNHHPFNSQAAKEVISEQPGPDLLFDTGYEHASGQNCDGCDRERLISRQPRSPAVHYGIIASGNQVIKDGSVRDKISHELGGVLCFEMEAAGIMNALPCLVIRGICDYADSHKSKIWQPYAAVQAAALAKDLLSLFSERQTGVPKHSKALVVHQQSSLPRRLNNRFVDLNSYVDHGTDLVRQDYFIKYNISDYNHTAVHSHYASRRCPGTTQWIIRHPTYTSWLKQKYGCLWLTGKIGSGKTLITSTIVEHLTQETEIEDQPQIVLHYFYSHSRSNGLSATALIDSLVQQVLGYVEKRQLDYSPEFNADLKLFYGHGAIRSSYERIIDKILLPLVGQVSTLVIVIDGLDECDTKEVVVILGWMHTFMQQNNIKLVLSGRESLDIAKSIPGSSTISISDTDSANDIKTYIAWQLKIKSQQRCITDNQAILSLIETSLAARADSMILWVYLQIENIWEDCYTDNEIRTALENLPKDLDETYLRCIRKIESCQGVFSRRYAMKILPWVFTAQKPLTLIELREALAINPTRGTLDRQDIPMKQDLLRSCANLLTLIREYDDQDEDTMQVHLVHHSLRQFLRAPNKSSLFSRETEQLFDADNMALADLCIRHLLSDDYALSLQATVSTDVHLAPPAIELVTSSIPKFLRRFVPSAKAHTMHFTHRGTSFVSRDNLPAIFHYARDQWPSLTRTMSQEHQSFPLFAEMVLQPNLIYRFHPWQPLGQSFNSHISGLLAWSIVNHHTAMLKVLFVAGAAQVPPEILGIPIPQYGYHDPVILAVRCNAVSALSLLESYKPQAVRTMLKLTNLSFWTPLHHAADTGSYEMYTFLRDKYFPTSEDIRRDIVSRTPLMIAISRRDAKGIEVIARPSDFDFHECRNEAIQKGDVEIVALLDRILYNSGGSSESEQNRIIAGSETSVSLAIADGHSAMIEYLLSEGLMQEHWLWKPLEKMIASLNVHAIEAFTGYEAEAYPMLRSAMGRACHEVHGKREVPIKKMAINTFTLKHWMEKAVKDKNWDSIGKACLKGVNAGLFEAAEGSAVIHLVAASCTDLECFNLCLESCTDWDVRDYCGATPLMLAARNANPVYIMRLLTGSGGKVKVDISARDQKGLSALDYYCAIPRGTIFRKLDRGACATLLLDHGLRVATHGSNVFDMVTHIQWQLGIGNKYVDEEYVRWWNKILHAPSLLQNASNDNEVEEGAFF